jgi:hypothetical protein
MRLASMLRRCSRFFASARLERFQHVLAASPTPVENIRTEFRSSFQPNQSFIDYAGSTEAAGELGQLLIQVFADAKAFDELRFLFVNKIAEMPRLPTDLCATYLTALSRSETFSLEELDGTLDLMRQRGANLDDPICAIAVSEMRLRCGVEATDAVLQALQNTDNTEALNRAGRYLTTAFKSAGWTNSLLSLAVVLVRHSQHASLLTEFLQGALVKDRGIDAMRVADVVLALATHEKLLLQPADLVGFIVHSSTLLSHEQIQRFESLTPADKRFCFAEIYSRRQQYDDLFRILAQLDSLSGAELRRVIVANAPLTGQKIDASYYALERRRQRGDSVPVHLLDLIMWQSAWNADVERATQTVAAYEDFGHNVTPVAEKALQEASRASRVWL